jgi:hypothetical protein
MTRFVTCTAEAAPVRGKARFDGARASVGLAPDLGTARVESVQAAGWWYGAPKSVRFFREGPPVNEADCRTGHLSSSSRTETKDTREAISQKNEGARIGRVSLAVGQIYEIDAEPLVKARMLRELAVWYRAMAPRAANPVIWESRLHTAEDLDAEARRLEQQRGGGFVTVTSAG